MRTSVQQQEQVIQRRSGIPMAQPEAPTPPQQEQRPGLTASGSGSALIPGARQRPQQQDVPEAGDPYATGALFGPGGNMLRAWALDVPDDEDSSMRVVFTVPGLPGGVTLDFGDGSPPHDFDSAGGRVEYEYPALSVGATSVVYDATVRDEHNRLRGWLRFRMPHTRSLPQDLSSGHPASLVV
jgi:hypothetical protein